MSAGPLPSPAPVGALVPAVGSILVVSFTTAFLITPLVRNLARARGWVDRPDGVRKLHTVPVPRLGGLAVYFAFILSCGGVLLAAGADAERISSYLHLAGASAAVMLLGLADDLVGVSPGPKLVVQTLAGLYLYQHGYHVELLSNPFGDPIALGWLSLPLTLIWFVGMSNAFNLIDGLDGLAAGVGFFATSTVFVAALVNDRWESALAAAALAGALFGFLRYNFNPASIFLGDCGSLFVGFALAALAVRGNMKSSTAIAVAAPLLALALPIMDTAIAMTRRLARGQPVFSPDAEHIHHRMLRRGFTPRGAVVVLYGVAALFGALSLLSMSGEGQVLGLVVIVFSGVTWVGVQQLGYSELGLEWMWRHGLRAGRRNVLSDEKVRRLQAQCAEARDLAALWRALEEAVRALGFSRVELVVLAEGASPQRLVGALDPADGGPQWSTTIPLLAGSRALGEVVLRRRLGEAPLPLEAAELTSVVARDVAECLGRLRPLPATEPQAGGGALRAS